MTSRPIIAFTSGCFDGGLHAGHRYLLEQMNALDESIIVIVGLNSDDYIRRKKNREPLRPAVIRRDDLFATNLVDNVVEFDEDGPLKLIMRYKPDYIVVGDDYSMDQIVGAKECEKWGGKVVRVPRLAGFSTTAQIQEIKKGTIS